MDFDTHTAALTALFASGATFGFANSLHCAGMCGPLAAFFIGSWRAAAAWHAARTLAYVAVGAAAGAVGGALGIAHLDLGVSWLAFALAAALLLSALGLGARLRHLRGPGKLLTVLVTRARSIPPTLRGAVFGLLTPLLPCGLLWIAAATAAGTGRPEAGATAMGGFALGYLPALVLVQANAGWLRRRLGAATFRHAARATMLVAAAILVFRGITALGDASCCH